MTRRTRKGRAHSARPNLSLEHLESRDLMAADAAGAAATPLLDPVDVTDTTQPALVPTPATNTRLRNSRPPSAPVATVVARSFDGTGNNLANREWGSTNEQLLRVAENDY